MRKRFLAILCVFLLLGASALFGREVKEMKIAKIRVPQPVPAKPDPAKPANPGGVATETEELRAEIISEEGRDPEVIKVNLRDGSIFVGKVKQETYTVHTRYGKLVVPKAEVRSIKFGSHGDPDQTAKIGGLVDDLGDEDPKVREEAFKKLHQMGRQIIPAIEALIRSEDIDDPETLAQVKKLLTEAKAIDPSEFENLGEDDIVVTPYFTIVGKVELPQLEVTTDYGKLTLKKKDLARVLVGQPESITYKISVSGAYTLVGKKWLKTGIPFDKGFRYEIKADGAVLMPNYRINTPPDGLSNYGNRNGFTMGALVGKIGNKSFKAGSESKGKAAAKGYLSLAVNLRSVGTEDGGSFEVTIKVMPE